MIKKITLISLFVLFAGVLIAGGVYRTTAKSANETRPNGQETAQSLEDHEKGTDRQGQGLGNGGVGQGRNQNMESEQGDQLSNGQGNQGQGNQGQGNQGHGNQGQGSGRSLDEEGSAPQEGQGYQGGQGRGQNAERAGEIYQEHESIIIEGIVTQAPDVGVDMIVKTTDDQEVLVGTGPGYLQEMGFELFVGDTVQVSGFLEEDEFKAETISSNGEMIALRDEFGRPMWSGAARNARGGGNQGGGNQGGGNQGGGNGQGRQTG